MENQSDQDSDKRQEENLDPDFLEAVVFHLFQLGFSSLQVRKTKEKPKIKKMRMRNLTFQLRIHQGMYFLIWVANFY